MKGSYAHNLLLDNTRSAKAMLTDALEMGMRNPEALRERMDAYISYQQAADLVQKAETAVNAQSDFVNHAGAAGREQATQPTELEMHRADYQACKVAGFESPGELLAAHNKLAGDCLELHRKLDTAYGQAQKAEADARQLRDSLAPYKLEKAIEEGYSRAMEGRDGAPWHLVRREIVKMIRSAAGLCVEGL